MVKQVDSVDEFNNCLAESTSKLLVVDFHATWCGPCRNIAPQYAELSNKYTDVNFIKVDVDELNDISEKYKVTAMPTFMVFKNKEKVDEVVGANITKVEEMIKKHK